MKDLRNPDNLALQNMLMPDELNHFGVAFGGTILSWLDKAGALAALKVTKKPLVLASMKEANFILPIHPRELVSIYAQVVKTGTTSITVEAQVWTTPLLDQDAEATLAVTAEIIYVSVDGKTLAPTPHETEVSI